MKSLARLTILILISALACVLVLPGCGGGTGSSTNTPTTTTNHTITATAGTGGTISPHGMIPVRHGMSQTFAITAAGGYAINDVKVDNLSKGNITTYTFSNVTADHVITATFTANPANTNNFTPNYIENLDNLLHWNHLPVKVAFVVPSDISSLGWNTSMFSTAAQEWNQAGKQALVTVVSPDWQPDVTVSFIDRNDPNYTGGPDSTGYTDTRYYEGTLEIVSATIQITKTDPQGHILSPGDMQVTVAHEVGHALGINGHSPEPTDLLYFQYTAGDFKTPTQRDLNTIMSAYPQYFSSKGLGALETRSTRPAGPIRRVIIE